MKRALVIALVLLGCSAFVLASAGAGEGEGSPSYVVELDNAFGLIEGADVKVAGVRAGEITELKLDRKTKRALVGIKITKTGFGSLRSDVRCESRPQSLIGEYFVDCLPGVSKRTLPAGSTIPVERTASTIAPDLVNNILRRPFRERLTIILAELGAGVGARGDDLNAALRRANPALRETNRVLGILAKQNKILADLARNGDAVLSELADNRKDVSRWAVEARDTAEASASRERELAEQFREFPGFLRELRPTMAALGDVADEQRPVLQDLRTSANQLERFFDNLGPFSDASRPAVRSLGRASDTGEEAARAATPTVAELRRFTVKTPELANNLAIILDHLNDRDNASELDPRSPGGQGYTGLEALLQYPMDQSTSINIFDRNAHILKVAIFPSESCGPYADAARAKEHLECGSYLGPNQMGVTTPDPTMTEPAPEGPPIASSKNRKRTSANAAKPAGPAAPAPRESAGSGPANGQSQQAIALPKLLQGLLDEAGKPESLGIATDRGRTDDAAPLLEYLLAP